MGRPLRALVVEDSEDDARLVVRQLERGGFDVEFARVDTPETMADALKGSNWDVVLSDHSMPHFNSIAALDITRRADPDMPFVVVSGSIGEELAVTLMRMGAKDYVWKDNLKRLTPTVERELKDAAVRRQRREALQELRESEERYRRLADNAPDILYRISFVPSFKVDYVSPACKEILGYSPEELASNPELWKKIVSPENAPIIERVFEDPDSHSESFVIETNHRNGRKVVLEFRPVPIRDDKGRVIAHEGIARDISEMKKAEGELRRRKEDAETAILRAQTYLDFICHDISNILSPVMMYAEMISKDDKVPLGARERAGKIERQVDRTAAFVRFTRRLAEAEKISFKHLPPVDLRSVFERAQKEVEMRFPGRRLNVVCHYPREGEILARGEGWIEDVVYEIIDNSVKHTEKNEVSISIGVKPAQTGMDESMWKVEIADDGPGIPDVIKSGLTVDPLGAGNRFTRGVASALTFMSLIMEELGGQLKIENRIPGDYAKGTKVSLLVPSATELPSPSRPAETH